MFFKPLIAFYHGTLPGQPVGTAHLADTVFTGRLLTALLLQNTDASQRCELAQAMARICIDGCGLWYRFLIFYSRYLE